MNEITVVFNAIKEIGFMPVIVVLILLFHFRSVRNLEKQEDRLWERNERLLEIIIDLIKEKNS